MKLILRADIENLGRLGEIVTVKPGYGRNYLVPQGLAMLATEGNQKVFEQERRKLQEKMDSIRFSAQETADKIKAAPITIEVRVGEGDKLYGSVTTANIADALTEAGIEIDRRKIVLDDPIRSLGVYSIQVRLHPDVQAEIALTVKRHGLDEVEEEPVVEAPVETAEPVEESGQAEETAE
ncbi:50S ribosomal protein L9 [Desulfovibrio inopinatus]|uniref:50S ribosomal protein L9 n=1 Tax=Desulfovibrio inopinatus TaxID=102109 RepID=UPI0004194A66|nr:50S ribosomal protein L9 [Desulfovibrio inopinatus]